MVGRLIQGIGTGGPRTAIIALVRDQHGGRAMARIMSVVMAIFIIVPAIAPALGQAVLLAMGWRAIFDDCPENKRNRDGSSMVIVRNEGGS